MNNDNLVNASIHILDDLYSIYADKKGLLISKSGSIVSREISWKEIICTFPIDIISQKEV